MLHVLVLTLCLLTTANSFTSRQQPSSAASEAQIRFAIENKYDGTGPGAKGREYAYKTYRTLEEALVNYLDDPDTTLPDHEREKAMNFLKLQSPNQIAYTGQKRPFSESFDLNSYLKPVPPVLPPNLSNKQVFQQPANSYGLFDLRGFPPNEIPQEYQKGRLGDGYSFQKIQTVKGNPVSLAHYTRRFADPGVQGAQGVQGVPGATGQTDLDQFDPNPQYSYSYGVNNKQTGDTKSAHEARAGGVVRGFYSLTDADGRTRTVHYTADDAEGFRAQVQRSLPHEPL